MKKINEYITKKTKEFIKKKRINSPDTNVETLAKQKQLENYELWLQNLRQLMKNGQYRQLLKDIEEKKNRFKIIKTELWRYRSP